MRFGSAAGDRAITEAIQQIEAGSSAEIVVAVREHARRWWVQHGLVGVVAGVATLVFAALREWAPWATIAFPIGAAVLAVAIVEYLPPLRRGLVPEHVRDAHVLDAARAQFVARGVHATTGRTGVLVYLALRPRACEIVGDVAVVDRIGQAALDQMSDKLAAAIPAGAAAVAEALAALAPELARALPRLPGDRDELPDEPVRVH